MKKELKKKALVALILSDILDSVKWFSICMLVLHLIYQANVEEITGIEFYQYTCAYLIAAALKIAILPRIK